MGNKPATPKKLDKKTIQKYKEITKLSEDEIQEWYQEFYEDCPSGKLTLEQFRKIFVHYFRRRHAKPFCNAIFQLYDRDKDGALSFEEFLIAISPPSQLEFKDHLNLLFDVYDKPGNKRIGKEELITMIEAMCDLIDSPESIDAEQIEEIANEIISAVQNNTDAKDFDKQTIVEECYKNPDIRELLAPNLTDDNGSEKKNNDSNITDASPLNKSSESSTLPQSSSVVNTTDVSPPKKNSESGSLPQSPSALNKSSIEKTIFGYAQATLASKNKIIPEAE